MRILIFFILIFSTEIIAQTDLNKRIVIDEGVTYSREKFALEYYNSDKEKNISILGFFSDFKRDLNPSRVLNFDVKKSIAISCDIVQNSTISAIPNRFNLSIIRLNEVFSVRKEKKIDLSKNVAFTSNSFFDIRIIDETNFHLFISDNEILWIYKITVNKDHTELDNVTLISSKKVSLNNHFMVLEYDEIFKNFKLFSNNKIICVSPKGVKTKRKKISSEKFIVRDNQSNSHYWIKSKNINNLRSKKGGLSELQIENLKKV